MKLTHQSRIRHQATASRAGSVSVEFAIVAPLFFLMVISGIEISRANMLFHTTSIAATEAARHAIIAGATAEETRQIAMNELAAVGIADADIYIDPPEFNENTEFVVVGVSVPLDAKNGYLAPRLFLGDSVIDAAGMTREAKSSDGGKKLKDATDKVRKKMRDDAKGKKDKAQKK